MAAYPAGGPALSRIVLKGCDLHRTGVSARQGSGTARHGRNDRISHGYHPEVDDTRADAQLDTSHAAARAALRSYSRCWKVQQLGVIGDEDQFGFSNGEFDRPDQ